MTACLVALGSNQGDRVGILLAALDDLGRQPGIQVVRVSSFFETAPVGGPAGQEKYFNGVAVLETELAAAELMAVLLVIEQRHGRQRREPSGPRTLDLDLLYHGEQILETPALTLPHPRMHERRFVLAPAAEVAADWLHPRLRQSTARLLADLSATDVAALGMRVITSASQMQSEALKLRRDGQRIGLVPTMGALHEGHLSLVRIARRRADRVVATIFVNPTQFSPSEDFSKYPRTLDGDLRALSQTGCDFVFLPTAEEIYPPGFSTFVEPPAVAQPWEGVCRKGHFRGVATIVLKLFQLIPADFACFGQKDYQQLQVIRRMVQELALPIEIVPCPIVREADGLAMSSRNRYLSPAQRQQALALSRALARAESLVRGGERDAAAVAVQMQSELTAAGILRIDYTALADPETLAEKKAIDGPAVALIAAYVGDTRLIDNRLLFPS